MSAGSATVADDGAQGTLVRRSVGTILPRKRLGEAQRCLGDLLEEIVRSVAAVDVAGGHLGGDHVVVVDRQLPNRRTSSA